jgi:hypothetical protein
MVPTFLQKRRSSARSLGVWLTWIGLSMLLIGYSLAVSFIIADRALVKTAKLPAIVILSITALLVLGLFERLKR